ncbi:TPA: hypothetical protein ACSPZ7_002580, partial [Aeromonas veronii]
NAGSFGKKLVMVIQQRDKHRTKLLLKTNNSSLSPLLFYHYTLQRLTNFGIRLNKLFPTIQT